MINNLKKFVRALWDWDCLEGCFGNTDIKMGDIDGIIERNGQFLLIETKGSYKEVGGGQARMFDALVKTGYFTVIVVRGPTNNPRELRKWPSYWIPCNMKIFKEVVTDWFVQVDV